MTCFFRFVDDQMDIIFVFLVDIQSFFFFFGSFVCDDDDCYVVRGSGYRKGLDLFCKESQIWVRG